MSSSRINCLTGSRVLVCLEVTVSQPVCWLLCPNEAMGQVGLGILTGVKVGDGG